jgi:polyisoprenoid-binding protein YceI
MTKFFALRFTVMALSTFSVFPVFCQTQKAEVDLKKSSVEWTGKKLTGEHYGNVALTKGELLFKDIKLSGGSFEIDMTSITCSDISDDKSNKRLVDHLKSEDFFAVAKFPTAKFVITKADLTGTNNYNISGDLTIKGITHTITFPATVNIVSGVTSATATIVFDRSKYDIKFGSQSFFENLGDKLVYDDVEMKINLVADLPGAK